MSMPELIKDAEALADLVQAVASAEVVALDTEFQREGRHTPQLCLMQVALPGGLCVAVDPLEALDLDPLFDALAIPGRPVVLHDARQDLEVFAHLKQPVPPLIFDTQVAVGFVQHTDGRQGYAKTVEGMLGVTVKRDQSMSDWSKRPLRPAQIKYALDDVEHLLPLYTRLKGQLEREGRLAWAMAASAQLREEAIEAALPKEAWQRVSGAKQLKGRGLACLAALAGWREEEAARRDTLAKRVMSDSILVALAKRGPTTMEDLEDMRLARRWVRDGHGPAMLEALGAISRDPSEWPRWPKGSNLPGDPRLGALVLVLDGCLKAQCRALNISPWLVGSRADIERLTRRWMARRGKEALEASGEALVEGWRGEAFGKLITALLAGEAVLKIDLSTPSGVQVLGADL